MKPTLDRSRGHRSRLFGIPVPPRPFETLAISGAPTVRVGSRDSRMVLELNGETVGAEEDLTARLASDRPEGVNLASHPAVSVDYLVGVLDAIRSAGVTRVAIPPVARDGE